MLEALGEGYVPLLEAHNEILDQAIRSNGGVVVRTEGDAFFAAFDQPSRALAATRDAQKGLAERDWPDGGSMRVRIGIHTGEAIMAGTDYTGLEVHRAARISDAAHGGQSVLSEETARLVERSMPEGTSLRDLGKHRLKDLSEPETIFQLDIRGLAREFPPLRTLDAIPNNLPVQLTSFVGRQELLEEAEDLLESNRLLTLTGPGGTGKTRVALQTAANVSHRFGDGVYFVDLSPVSEADVVPSVILSSLGIQASTKDQDPLTRLLDQVGNKEVLLVLDNFEQLLDAAPVVADLVRTAPRSKVIVTSRAPLNISGEQELPVPPLRVAAPLGDLSMEPEDVEAVRLFVDRARSVQPGFALESSNSASVLELVNKLDGLPLAIELVASRVRMLPVPLILSRLDSKMLAAGSVDLPERQQTIEAAIDWSYELLDESTRALLARMSVFAGGARLHEIETVCQTPDNEGYDLFEGLTTLVNHSLVRSIEGVAEPRFRMLHVIREYGRERLAERGDADRVHKRHLEAYVSMVEEVAPELTRADRKKWLDVLEEEHDNLRDALEWGTGREVDLVLRLTSASWRFWQARGHLHEAATHVRAALAQAGGSDRYRAKALEALGGILWWQGEMDGCLEAYTEALRLQRGIGDARELANALYNYSLPLSFSAGEPEQAASALDEAERIYVELDDPSGLADIQWGRGQIEMAAEDFEASIASMLEAADFYRQAGNEFGLGWSLFEAGDAMRRMGRIEEAWPLFLEGLRIFSHHDDVSALVLFLSASAGVAKAMGDEKRAVRLAGAYHGFRVTSGADLVVVDINQIDGLDYDTLESLGGELGDAYREGKRMSIREAIDYGMAGPTDEIAAGPRS